MKKVFSLALMALTVVFSACAQDRVVTFEQLPANAQKVIKQYFTTEGIAYIKLDKEFIGTEYEVRYTNGTEIDFTDKGEIKKVDCGLNQVPEALIPEQVKNYVRENYSTSFIKEWKLDDGYWKAELNTGLELIFNKKYQFVGIDD